MSYDREPVGGPTPEWAAREYRALRAAMRAARRRRDPAAETRVRGRLRRFADYAGRHGLTWGQE